jgi:DNA-directed RNA polymerase subunit M/transcription elongation factor TFIIS
MKIVAQCPNCSSVVTLSGEAIDKRARCPKCRILFKIPNPHQLKKAITKIKDSKSSVAVDEQGIIYA